VYGSVLSVDFSSSRIRLGVSSCSATTWIADSSLVSKLHSGAGSNLELRATVSRQKSDPLLNQSIAPPQIAALSSGGAAVSGSTSITVTAFELSQSGRSQRVSIGLTACSSSNWVSSSSVLSKLLPGVGLRRSVSVSSVSQAGSHSTLLSYTNPLPLEGYSISAIPVTGAYFVTIRGGMFAHHPSGPLNTDAFSHAAVTVGSTFCIQSTWKSDSSAVCRVAPGIGVDLSTKVSIFMQSGHISKTISYLSASISSIHDQKLPTSGAVSVSIYGFGFGLLHSSLVISFRTTQVPVSLWTSDSSVSCKAHVVVGLSISIRASVGTNVGSASANLISATVPTISALTMTNLAKSGSLSLTIIGSSYGAHFLTPATRLHKSDSLSSEWRSDSSLKSKIPGGRGTRVGITVSVSLQKSSSEIEWASYNTVLAISTSMSFVPTSGSSFLTLFGHEFGAASYSQKIRLGSSVAEFHVWVSESVIVAKSIHGFGSSLSMTATLDSYSFVSNTMSFTAPAPFSVPFFSVSCFRIRQLHSNWHEIFELWNYSAKCFEQVILSGDCMG